MRLIPRLIILALILVASIAPAQNRVENRHVAQRMQLMQTGRAAVDVLTGMMSNRIRFDKPRARAARKSLIKMTDAIPKHFRKRRTDPLSNAKITLWINWTDFKYRAKGANNAARALNARSLNGLRTTLPDLMQTCLSCHRAYRKDRKMVKTH